MEPFLYALNAVLPIVLLTVLGYFLRRIGMIDSALAGGLNKLCFHVFLPTLLFLNIYDTEGLSFIRWDIALFALAAIMFFFFIGLALVLAFVKERRQKGVVLQCIFRSNFSIMGLPLALALYGQSGGQTAAVLSLFTIPLYNILGVIALRLFSEDEGKPVSVSKTLRDIVTNKLIIGVLLGLLTLCVRALLEMADISFRMGDIRFLYSFLSGVAGVTTPLALIALGAQFNLSSVRGLRNPIILGTVIRVLIVPAAALTIAYRFFPSFNGAPFAALVALFASPVAVSSAIMASEMGGDGELAGQLVVWTTLASAFTVFGFVSLFRALGAL